MIYSTEYYAEYTELYYHDLNTAWELQEAQKDLYLGISEPLPGFYWPEEKEVVNEQ
jgi:hypothetical protein